MKHILFLFLIALPLFGHSQNQYEINLSKTLNETRLGIWTKGDYKIYVELDILETSFRNTGNSFLEGVLNNNYEDSVAAIYNLIGKRYLKAADQLKKSGNGFDLKKLIVYYVPENEKENSGSSSTVENSVRQLLENGMSAVYYKGERVFTLKKRHEPQGYGLDFGYNVQIYFDDEGNCIFKYFQHLGW